MKRFEDNLFYGCTNRFVGSGGEILIKGEGNAYPTRMEVGDRLIGIGITETVECLDGNDSGTIRTPGAELLGDKKLALRAFEITAKRKLWFGHEISLSPLAPREYSRLVEEVSNGAVKIPAESIPEGTLILSFIDPETTYTLEPLEEGIGQNWINATKGERHWNVGIGKPDDFWMARFPSDNIGLLKFLPAWMKLGGIWFGLSLLPGSNRALQLEPVPHHAPIKQDSRHHFCLKGRVVGSFGQKGQFPIGLRTKITFQPTVTSNNSSTSG